MKKISSYAVFSTIFAAMLYNINANAAISCGTCVSDGGYGYHRTCCENRIDADGQSYEYCTVVSCLPGGDIPDKIREGDAPGFTRPPHYAIPDLNNFPDKLASPITTPKETIIPADTNPKAIKGN